MTGSGGVARRQRAAHVDVGAQVPHAALRTVTLTDFGADPSALGATALAALAAVESTD